MAGLRQLVRSALSMPQYEEPRVPSCVQPSLCVTGSPMCGSSLAPSRPRSAARSQAMRGSPPTPAALSRCRKCVPRATSANMFVALTVTRHPRSGNLPTPSRHRSRTLSQTARGRRDPPASLSRIVPTFARRPPAPTRMPRSTGGTRHPRSGNLPTPSRHRSRTLSQTGLSQTLGPRATLTVFSSGCASWVPGAICSVGTAIPAEVTK